MNRPSGRGQNGSENSGARRPEILVVEPLTEGHTHSKLNAGLVSMLGAAFPGDRIRFHAEPSHLGFVRDAVPTEARVSWHEIDVPPYGAPEGLRRLPGELSWLAAFRTALARRPRLGLICAYSQLSLAFTKLVFGFFKTSVPVYGIIHSILKSVAEPPTHGVFRRALSPARTLSWPHPRNLRHLALGRSIVSSVREEAPEVAKQFDWIPKPWQWPDLERAGGPPQRKGDIVFTIVGSRGARLNEAVQLARAFYRRRPGATCRIEYVGSTPEGTSTATQELLGTISAEALTDQEFARRLARATYVVSLNRGRKYDFVASGAFHDGLHFGKPGFHLRTKYVEERLAALGDIGEIHDTIPDLAEALGRAYDTYDPVEYFRKSERVIAASRQHSPTAVAPRFRRIYEDRFGTWVPAGAEDTVNL